jgi:hypothetical protein
MAKARATRSAAAQRQTSSAAKPKRGAGRGGRARRAPKKAPHGGTTLRREFGRDG